MADGRSGVVAALLLYTLIVKFVHPANGSFKRSHNNIDLKNNNDNYEHGIFYKQTNIINCISGYGEYAFSITFLTTRRFYRRKLEGTVRKQLHNNAVIIAICLLLSGEIHQCPGPTIATDEGSIVDNFNSTTTQVCSSFRDYPCFETRLQPYTGCCVPYPSSMEDLMMVQLSSETDLARSAGAAHGDHLEQNTSRGGLLSPSEHLITPEALADEWLVRSVGVLVSTDGQPSMESRTVEPVGIYSVSKMPLSQVAVGGSDYLHASSSDMEFNDKFDEHDNKKKRVVVNRAIQNNRKFKFFQTVNNSRIIWDLNVKPKGILGGHLNIRSLKSKSDQINHILLESNLDYLCLSETWLH